MKALILVTHHLAAALQVVCARLKELDLVVIDLHDGCRGLTLLRAIRTCREDLPIVVMSSRDTYHASALAFANGASASVAKPVTSEELKSAVTNPGLPTPELIAA